MNVKNRSQETNKGTIFIIAAPSGSGKSTIVRKLLEEDKKLEFSVSFTSRPPRPGEVDGRDYHFISVEEFRRKIENNEFLEWAKYVDNYYGTERSATEKILTEGRDLLLDIDIQGADNIKKTVHECIRFFILPPSKEVLIERLRHRGTNTEEDLAKRIATAGQEVVKATEYDYIVINNNLDEAVADVLSIIHAERLRTERNKSRIVNILRSFR